MQAASNAAQLNISGQVIDPQGVAAQGHLSFTGYAPEYSNSFCLGIGSDSLQCQ